MSPANHAFISWWTANVLPLSKRDRLVVFLAGVLPDLDGLTLLYSREAYINYHHLLTHNLLACLAWTALVALVARQRLACALLTILNWHLHLACDYFVGAGPDGSIWKVHYLYPLLPSWDPDGQFIGPRWYGNPWQLQLNAWPSVVVLVIFAIGWVYIAVRLNRTWFEFIWPRMDQELCKTLRKWFGGQPVEVWPEREAAWIRSSFVALTSVALLACVVVAARTL